MDYQKPSSLALSNPFDALSEPPNYLFLDVPSLPDFHPQPTQSHLNQLHQTPPSFIPLPIGYAKMADSLSTLNFNVLNTLPAQGENPSF